MLLLRTPYRMATVYIIDVESGNLQSLENAIRHIGEYDIKYIRNADDFAKYDSEISTLLFPGVGNYGHFVHEIHSRKLAAPIKSYIGSGRALMGICVGLQALLESSEESAGVAGLGYLRLPLKKFNPDDAVYQDRRQRKAVPHIGWNSVNKITVEGKETSDTLYGINTINKYYFVHSYAALLTPEAQEQIAESSKNGWEFAFTRYGSEHFIAAISYGNFFATQFHPEKSGVAGLRVLKAFLTGNKRGSTTDTATQVNPGIETTLSGLTRRIIACLDVRANDAGDLVVTKGDQYDVRETGDSREVRNLGKPVELATKYYKQGADEVTFLNITSFRNLPVKDLPMLAVLKEAAKNIFVPLTVGGGIKSMKDPVSGEVFSATEVAHLYFRSGADKVSIGSDAVTIAEEYYKSGKKKTGGSSIEGISATFGAQAVVISVDPRRKYVKSPSDTTMETIEITNPLKYGPDGERFCYYQVTSQGGRKTHELGALELCLACEDLGAGEILLNSIDHDGLNSGYNLELVQQVKTRVSIPVIASSGAGKPDHFQEVFELDCGIDAALGAGLFHRGEYEVNDVKRFLQKQGMDVRLEGEDTL